MKVAITGHTSGIGLALTKVFPDFIGFSRSNGFDISKIIDQRSIASNIEDCEVFINNAFSDWDQIDLLYRIWDRWNNNNKTIVCIGSDAADHNRAGARPYNIQKRALEHACLQLQQAKMPCRVILVKPGYVETPRVSHIKESKIDPSEMASFIKQLVELNGSMWIGSVTMYPIIR